MRSAAVLLLLCCEGCCCCCGGCCCCCCCCEGCEGCCCFCCCGGFCCCCGQRLPVLARAGPACGWRLARVAADRTARGRQASSRARAGQEQGKSRARAGQEQDESRTRAGQAQQQQGFARREKRPRQRAPSAERRVARASLDQDERHLIVAAVLGAAVSAKGAGVRGSDNTSDESLPQFRLAQLDQVQAPIKELQLVSQESARLAREARALQAQLSAAPDGVFLMDWAYLASATRASSCSARELLLSPLDRPVQGRGVRGRDRDQVRARVQVGEALGEKDGRQECVCCSFRSAK